MKITREWQPNFAGREDCWCGAHVLVNDPTRGDGIFIENMLDAAG